VPLTRVGTVNLYIAADDDGTGTGIVEECREDNNTCALVLDNPPFPDPPPVAVGPALRATAHGDPNAATCTADFNWALDAGLPRPVTNHYHILRSTDPRFLPIVPGTDPWLATVRVDSTPATPIDQLPTCHFYLVVAADRCEQTELP
jgi:hypothetical protein